MRLYQYKRFILLIGFASVTQAQAATLVQISIHQHRLNVEIADTHALKRQGLMHRTQLKPNHGMLFVYHEPKPRYFWMKNTYIPLSIAFADEHQCIFKIGRLRPDTSFNGAHVDAIASEKPAQYVIEAPWGWFEQHQIDKGDCFKFVQ